MRGERGKLGDGRQLGVGRRQKGKARQRESCHLCECHGRRREFGRRCRFERAAQLWGRSE